MGSTPHILGDPLVTPVKRDVMQSNEKYYFAGKCGRHLKMVTTMILEKVLVMNNRGASQILAEHVFEGTLLSDGRPTAMISAISASESRTAGAACGSATARVPPAASRQQM